MHFDLNAEVCCSEDKNTDLGLSGWKVWHVLTHVSITVTLAMNITDICEVMYMYG